MPSDPTANLVVGQVVFALGLAEGVLDENTLSSDACQGFQGGLFRDIGEHEGRSGQTTFNNFRKRNSVVFPVIFRGRTYLGQSACQAISLRSMASAQSQSAILSADEAFVVFPPMHRL